MSIEIYQPIAAPPDALWQAISTPEGLRSWQADLAEPEGSDAMATSWPTLEVSVVLRFEVVVPGRSIRFRTRDSLTELDVVAGGLRLRHEGSEVVGDAVGVRASWAVSLLVLAHSLERHAGRERWVHWQVESAPCSGASLHPFLTKAALLRRWLTDAGDIPGAGSAYQLVLRSGVRLSGRVLANEAEADVALTVSEHDGAVLGWRSLPSLDPEQRRIALCWSQWGCRPPRLLVRELGSALAVLARELSREHEPRGPGESLH